MPFPSPGDLPDPGIELGSPALQSDALLSEPPEKLKTGVGSLIPSPGDLPDPGIEPGSPALQVDALPAKLLGKPIHLMLSHYILYDISTTNLLTLQFQHSPQVFQ